MEAAQIDADQMRKLERKLKLVRFFQILLIVSALASLSYAYILASRSMDTLLLGQPSDADIRRTILVELPLAAAYQQFDARLNEALDNQDIERARLYYNLARSDPENYAVRKETMERFRKHDKKWYRYWISAKTCVKSIFTRDTSTGEGLACNMASDVFVVGDVADLSRQTWNWARGQETDEVIIGLSLFGVGATAISAFTANPVPASSVAAAKTVLKSGKNGNRFVRVMKPLVKSAVNMPLLRKSLGNLTLRETAAMLKQPTKFLRPGPTRQLGKIFGRIKVINNRTSFKGTIGILKHVSTVKQLARAERMTKIFAKQTPGIVQVMGARAFKLMKVAKPAARMTKYTYKTATNFFVGLMLLIPILLELVIRRFIRPTLKAYRKHLLHQGNPPKQPGRLVRVATVSIPLIAIAGLLLTMFLWQRDARRVADLSDPNQVAINYLYEDVMKGLNHPAFVKQLESGVLPKGKTAAALKSYLRSNCQPGSYIAFDSTKAECARLLRLISYSPQMQSVKLEGEEGREVSG